MAATNLYQPANAPAEEESFETLLQCGNVSIEKIQSPPATRTETYDQEQDEWIALLQGQASLQIEDRIVTLQSGDTLFIPAHTPHRVLETSTDPTCIWLAVHIHPPS
ncbi:MAG: cupin domain-containing protein [gamma proteobacterium endosymbiont of Lamellibrachia anaximandri]|nr:cupin domain-containing protein [gamma proteobacterium endosymbiont of Lamellibrachia anaximandri]MBL3617644.1 cupin domain-containing protein [gamma proteobacterium endosymbiont of Lamellibrachia anaximandri]